MKNLNSYLNFQGNTEEAFNFYKSVFGGEFDLVQRFKDTPEADRIPAHEREKIMHISLPVGKSTLLMGTDALESMGHKLTIGNNHHLFVDTENEDETRRIFDGLSAGGKVDVPLDKMFWGAYFGMCTDKFGVQWMVSYGSSN